MVCPSCGEEMECGILLPFGGRGGYYTTGMQWLPKDTALKRTFMPITRKGVSKCGGEVIKLCINNIALPNHSDVFICKKCRKLIIDY